MSGELIEARAFNDTIPTTSPSQAPQTYDHFQTTLPPFDDPELLPLLDRQQVSLTIKSSADQSLWTGLLVGLLPWILIIGFWIFFFKRMNRQGGMGGNMLNQFGKSGIESRFAIPGKCYQPEFER